MVESESECELFCRQCTNMYPTIMLEKRPWGSNADVHFFRLVRTITGAFPVILKTQTQSVPEWISIFQNIGIGVGGNGETKFEIQLQEEREQQKRDENEMKILVKKAIVKLEAELQLEIHLQTEKSKKEEEQEKVAAFVKSPKNTGFAGSWCAFCHRQANNLQKCCGCTGVFYCNRKCQKQNWKSHKTNCLQFRLLKIENEQLQRENQDLQERLNEKWETKSESEVQKFFDFFKTHLRNKWEEKSRQKWQFYVIGGDDCELHHCQWSDVYEEMNQELHVRNELINLTQNQEIQTVYRIRYLNDDEEDSVYHYASQTQKSTGYVRLLRCLSRKGLKTSDEEEKKILDQFLNIFGLEYWKKCAQQITPCLEYTEAQFCSKSVLCDLCNISKKHAQNMVSCLILSRPSWSAFYFACLLQAKSNILFLFHGLQDCNALESIVRNGFQLHYSNPGAFSRGFYFSTSFEMCFEYYTKSTENEHTERNTRTVLLCAVNVGEPFVDSGTRCWNQDEPCMLNGKLLESVQFQHLGATAYVVPLSQQIHALAAFEFTSSRLET